LAITAFGIKQVLRELYSGKKKEMKIDFTKSLITLAREREHLGQTSINRLKDLRTQVRGRTDLNRVALGHKILSLLLDFNGSKNAKKRMIVKREERLQFAIEEFKLHPLDLSAPEYILVLQIFRKIQSVLYAQQGLIVAQY
jgi:hypothetical protein